jgi:hypothetical protein
MDITIPAYFKSLLNCMLLAVLCALHPVAAQEAEAPIIADEPAPESWESIVTEEPQPAQPQESESYPMTPVYRPYWTLEIKGGEFEPELEEWETFYGDDRTEHAGLAAAYKFLRQAEVGLALDYIKDEGVGFLPLNDELGGEVKLQLYPAHLYVLLRGIFFEDQWVVPYVGGGLTRVYYRQKIENQASVRGEADGDHTRAGLQILLDWFDTGNAVGFEDEGVENSYLTIEMLSFSAEIDGIELGGESTMIGFAFEF